MSAADSRRFSSIAIGVAAICIISVSGMSGCASRGKNVIESSQSRLLSAQMANDFSEIPPVDLKMNVAHQFEIGTDSASAVADLAISLEDDELVFAKVFRLPNWQAPYSVHISSMVMGGLAEPAIFYPRYVMLDDKFKIVRRGAAREFVYRGIGAFGAITAAVFVNESNRDEAYVAIVGETRGAIKEQTSVMQSRGTTALAIPIKGFVLTWLIPTGGTELPKPMRGAAGGSLEVRLAAYNPKRFD